MIFYLLFIKKKQADNNRNINKKNINKKEIIIASINEIYPRTELKNKNLKKYIAGSFIFMILSGLLSRYFLDQANKEFLNNVNIALFPETINAWNTLFQIEKKTLVKKILKIFLMLLLQQKKQNKKK